ncbi:MAG: hypothetical protein IPH86_15695 [bacterium]|nr:hypothetical protein [bacterium]
MNRAGAFLFACAGMIGLAFLLPSGAAASWPGGSLANVPLCTATGDQSDAVSIPDGAGGAIVAWWDIRNGETSADIYAQRISAAGVALWATDGVPVCTAAGGQFYPVIVADGAGGAIVTWQDSRSGGTDIYAQRISAAGAVQWVSSGIAVCTVAGDQYGVVGATDGAGGVIVGWWDFRNGGGDTFVQRISAAGAVQWAAGGVLIGANGRDPAIVTDGAGGAIVAWQDYRSGFYSDVYAQRVSAGGAIQWPTNGVPISAADANQAIPAIVADGAGGAIVAWGDSRDSVYWDIYAQKVSSSGAVQWTVDGVALCTAAGQQYYLAMATDGAGGAIVTWEDARNGSSLDIYAQRISTAGLAQWTTDGVEICTFEGTQANVTIAADGAGGAAIAWADGRTGTTDDIYVQKISAGGVIQWPVNGGAVCSAANYQYGPVIVANGTGDVIVAWNDLRNGNTDIYAHGFDSQGSALYPMPRITSIRDIPNDQGGKVRVAWNCSSRDGLPALEISLYGIWREASDTAAQAALAAGASLSSEDRQAPLAQPGVFRMTIEGNKTLYWEGVGTVAARGQSTYTYVAPTLQDSTSAGPAQTVFMVDAHLAFEPGFYDSAADSGYSVDNLAPATPAPFTGRYLGNSTALHWGRSVAYDMAGYRLYRGDVPDFVPGPANFVVARTDTGFVDQVAGNHFYQLYAVDIHGNLSARALLSPQQTSAVPGLLPGAPRLLPNVPNPFNPLTTIRYELPFATAVDLAIYDARGHLIAQLRSGEREAAGRHEVAWSGRDHLGREVGAGVYIYRLKAGRYESSRRMTLLK